LPRWLRKGGLRKEGGKVSVVTYRLGLSGDDLSYPNTLLRMAVYRAMDHLLRNSVVGVLTESALAAAKVNVQPTATATATAERMPTPEEQIMSQLATAMDDGASTTKMELKRVRIGDNGRILLDAVAAFRDPSSGTTSRLDIIVRLALSPLDEDMILQTTTATSSNNDPQNRASSSIVRPNGCGIMASNAELRASFNKEMVGIPLEIFGTPIPDIWIPVISGGVAFPLGYRHRIVSVESRSSQDRMDVCGELYFNGDAPIQRKKNPWTMLPFLAGSGTGSSPPPPPPKRPALPGDGHQ
jgi:hypothetical protein